MENTTKILIIACIILVGALGLTTGMLLNKPATTEVLSTNMNSTNPTNTSTTTNNQPTWHYMTTYSGTDAEHGNIYTIDSNKKIKLLISGKPQANYESSDLVIAVYHQNMEGDIQDLNWTETEPANFKSATLYPKSDTNYEFRVGPHNMESWKVDVYEYY